MRSHEALAHPGRFEPQGGRNEEHDLIARYANRLARFYGILIMIGSTRTIVKQSLTNPICSSAGLETSPEDELGGVRGAQGRRRGAAALRGARDLPEPGRKHLGAGAAGWGLGQPGALRANSSGACAAAAG